MIIFKLHINPLQNDASYDVEGNYEELMKIDMNKIKEMNTLIQKINKTFLEEKIQDPPKVLKKTDNEGFSVLQINIPQDLINYIEKIDERIKFPLLWYFSSKPIMTVNEFLEASASTRFSLSHAWHPSAGGHFSTILVSQDKMFRDKGKKGKEKLWELTPVGKLKIKKEIKKLRSKIN